MGGEGDVAAAANWLLHRYIRDDVIGTLERLANDPNLVPQYPMP